MIDQCVLGPFARVHLHTKTVVWRNLHEVADPWQTLDAHVRGALLETAVDTELLFRELFSARALNPPDEDVEKAIMECERMSESRRQLLRARELARTKNFRIVDVPGSVAVCPSSRPLSSRLSLALTPILNLLVLCTALRGWKLFVVCRADQSRRDESWRRRWFPFSRRFLAALLCVR